MVGLLAEHADVFWSGFKVTTRLALYSFIIALVIGVIIASFRVSPIPPLQRFAAGYVATFRNSPLLVLFFIFYFGFTKLGVQFNEFLTAVIVLSAYTGAYLGEAVRSGINAIDVGQAEAARAVGLGFVQLLSLIIIPQALRTVVAPISNLFIANAKNTAIAVSISVRELTFVARQVGSSEADYVSAFLGAALLYMVSLLFAGAIFGWIEKRVAIRR